MPAALINVDAAAAGASGVVRACTLRVQGEDHRTFYPVTTRLLNGAVSAG